MATIVNTFFFLILLSLSLQTQLHARNTKFFTNLIHYNLFNTLTISSSPTPASAPTPMVVVTVVAEPVMAPTPQEYGYGLYGRGSSELSSEEDQMTSSSSSSTLEGGSKNGTPVETKEDGGPATDQYFTPTEKEAPFEKLNNGYSSSMNQNNGYMVRSENQIKGYNQNKYSNNGDVYSNSMNQNNGYNHNMYSNNGDGYSSSMNQNNGYNQNTYSNNGDGYSSSTPSLPPPSPNTTLHCPSR
ncbi:hypothetical protein L6452_02251 [Arctium lappa]|uniref:Uncharacterized protein n=1 Tax=Arctium lappa TaxID=4217 RepID=A0ACB9FJQ6_ARCLA|nr:hypothetical protein L6452_02251 [Arctium lappa]